MITHTSGHDRRAQGGAALARQPVRRHPAPADHAAGAGHRPDPQRAARPAHRDGADGQPGAGQPRRDAAAVRAGRRAGAGRDRAVAARRRVRLLGDLGRAGPLRPVRLRPGLGAAVVQHRRLRARAAHPPAGRGRLPRHGHPRRASTRRPARTSSTGSAPARWATRCSTSPTAPTPTGTAAASAGRTGSPRSRCSTPTASRCRPARSGSSGIELAVAVPGLLERLGDHVPVPAARLVPHRRPGLPRRRRAATTTWTGRSTRSTPATGSWLLHRAVRGAHPGRPARTSPTARW